MLRQKNNRVQLTGVAGTMIYGPFSRGKFTALVDPLRPPPVADSGPPATHRIYN